MEQTDAAAHKVMQRIPQLVLDPQLPPLCAILGIIEISGIGMIAKIKIDP
jgi:hypothetical protein